jgi:hypothetical protein
VTDHDMDDVEMSPNNENQWYTIQKIVDDLLSSESDINDSDYEISATRDSPSTIDVLLLSDSVCCKRAIERLVGRIRFSLMDHDDHWEVRFFVRAAHEVEMDYYRFYLWLSVRRAFFYRYLGRYECERWQTLEDFENAIWPRTS